jgi:PAS domain S-box-containing protein
MPYISMDRIARGLRWAGGALLVAGVALVAAAIGWTEAADTLITASAVAALAFGLPGFLAFALAYWLESTARRLSAPVAGASVIDAAMVNSGPFGEPWRGYAIAVAAVSVAWAARAALDAVIPQQTPFITFYVAVVAAGWLGGVGPAALATFASVVIAWFFFLAPSMGFRVDNPGNAIVLGLFTFVCLGMGAITAALRVALVRVQQLAVETARQAAMLRKSRERLRIMADTAPVLIRMSDTRNACVHVNETWLRFTGRTLEHELGDGWAKGVHPDDVVRCLSICASAFDQRQPFATEYRLRGADDTYRVVRDMGIARFDADGAFAGYVDSCMDVTDLLAPHLDAGRVAETSVAAAT